MMWEYCTPPFWGGAVELVCASRGIRVYGYDNFKPLVEFWECLLEDAQKLAGIVRGYHPLRKDAFYELQRCYGNLDSKYQRAAAFFVINRSSFSGCTMRGGMSPGHPRFTMSSIDRLENFSAENLTVGLADFAGSLRGVAPHDFLYLDPPYMIGSGLYGDRGNIPFDHNLLASMLKTRNNWILSYNNCREIHEMYGDYVIRYPEWKYGMSANKNSREVLILSHGVAERYGLA